MSRNTTLLSCTTSPNRLRCLPSITIRCLVGIAALAVLHCSLLSYAFAQGEQASASLAIGNTLTNGNAVGVLPYTAVDGENETVSLSNGALHVTIPLLSLPQLGGRTLDLAYTYDSKNWIVKQHNSIVPYDTTLTMVYEQECASAPYCIAPNIPLRLNLPTLSASLDYQGIAVYEAPLADSYQTQYCVKNLVFSDWSGAKHQFSNMRDCPTIEGINLANGHQAGNFSTFSSSNINESTDNSFIRLDTTNPNDIVVTEKDGTMYHFLGYVQNQNQLNYDVEAYYAATFSTMVDRNNNVVRYANSQLTDTVGRTVSFTADGIVYVDSNGVSQTIAYKVTAQSPSVTYTFAGLPSSTNGPCFFTYPQPPTSTLPTGSAQDPSPTQSNVLQYSGQWAVSGPAATTQAITFPGGRTFSLTYDEQGQLTNVVYPSGGYTRYDYTMGSVDAHIGAVTCVVESHEVSAKHVCSSASGSCSESQEATTLYSGQPLGGGTFGNLEMDVTDPVGDLTKHQFQVIPFDTVAPRESDTLVYDNASNLLRTTHTDYNIPADDFSYAQGWSLALPRTVTTKDYIRGSSTAQTTRSNSYVYDTQSLPEYLNCRSYSDSNTNACPIQSATIDNVSNVAESDFLGNKLRTTSDTWEKGGQYDGGTAHILDRRLSEALADNTISSTTSNTYDNAGNVLSSTRAGTSVASLTTHYTYTPTGDLQRSTDPLSYQTSYGYTAPWIDSACATTASSSGQPTSVTNALGQVTRMSYYSCSGLLAKLTDPNGAVTSYQYDSLGRLHQKTSADGGLATTTYTDSAPNSIFASQTTGGSTPIVHTTLLDGLSRTAQSQLVSDPTGVDYVDTTYDPVGRVASVSNPYRSTSDATYGVTTYSYDALNRTVSEIAPDNNTQNWTYSADVVDFHDYNNHHWQRSYDALNRLVTVLEPDVSNNATLETDYTYNALDNLTAVDQWGGAAGSSGERQRRFVYDGLGRLTSSQNPEAGAITYAFTNSAGGPCSTDTGDPCSRTDARGITTTYSYDALARLSGKSYSNDPTATPAVAFVYDSPRGGWTFIDQTTPKISSVAQTNLVGRLSYATNGTATTLYGYDLVGRKTLKSECTPLTCASGDHYDVHAFYDLAGNIVASDRGLDALKNAAMPNQGFYYGGLALNYNGAGQVTAASADISDATHPSSILSQLTYTPFGTLQTIELGSQYGQGTLYDKRGRMINRYSINASGALVVADQWNYDAVSNVVGISDSVYGNSSYQYDTLNRLVQQGLNASTGVQYTYDSWGNKVAETSTGGSTYQWSAAASSSNQATSILQYDSAGNVTQDGLHNYVYDAESRMIGVPDEGVRYIYDAEGMRVATVNAGTVAAEYIYNMDGELSTTVAPDGSLVRGILRVDDIHWGDYTAGSGSGGGTTEFRLVDHVGTLLAKGDNSGNLIQSCLSQPFGENMNCNPDMDYTESHFADKKRDQESGLDYFGARYYSSVMGRWMSPDWADRPEAVPYSDLMNPQSLNLYGYVNNNPLSRADKDGHCAEDFCVIEGGVTAYFAGAAVWAGASAYLSTPAGQRSPDTFTSAAGASFSSSFHSLTSLFSNSDSSTPTPAAPAQPRTAQDALPRDKDGRPVPDAEAAGNPHTQLGTKDGRAGPYTQGREFGTNGKPVKDIDHTDHGRPDTHPDNPHEHPYRPSDGKRMPQQPVDPKPPIS